LCHSDLTGDFEVIKLCDFGVAVPLKANGEMGTEAGAEYVGTLLWSAPEVLRQDGLIPITNKADMFSYGLVLWEMIALRPPHLDESLTEESSVDTASDDTMERSVDTATDDAMERSVVNACGKNIMFS
jgi:PDZ-binding kinase